MGSSLFFGISVLVPLRGAGQRHQICVGWASGAAETLGKPGFRVIPHIRNGRARFASVPFKVDKGFDRIDPLVPGARPVVMGTNFQVLADNLKTMRGGNSLRQPDSQSRQQITAAARQKCRSVLAFSFAFS